MSVTKGHEPAGGRVAAAAWRAALAHFGGEQLSWNGGKDERDSKRPARKRKGPSGAPPP